MKSCTLLYSFLLEVSRQTFANYPAIPMSVIRLKTVIKLEMFHQNITIPWTEMNSCHNGMFSVNHSVIFYICEININAPTHIDGICVITTIISNFFLRNSVLISFLTLPTQAAPFMKPKFAWEFLLSWKPIAFCSKNCRKMTNTPCGQTASGLGVDVYVTWI